MEVAWNRNVFVKVALVTGANKGIGLEVARQLGTGGVTVLIGVRNRALGEAAEATLKAEGHDAQFLELDVTRSENDCECGSEDPYSV